MSEENGTDVVEKPKKVKKLAKEISYETNTVTITVAGGVAGPATYDFNTLPADIQAKLGPFGLGHKLGDAAAGRQGPDAEAAITKVFGGLMASNWSVRAPAAPKVSLKEITDKLAGMDDDQRANAAALLESLGINIPGVTS